MELKDLRTALFGFKKSDVCEYISQLNDIYERREAQKSQEQQETMEALNQKNEELNDCASRLNQENTELKRRNDELQKKIELAEHRTSCMELQMKEIQEAAVSAIEEAKKQLSAAERRISELRAEQGYEKQPEIQ